VAAPESESELDELAGGRPERVTELDLTGLGGLGSSVEVCELLGKCPSLKQAHLADTNASDATCSILGGRCPMLAVVDLMGCSRLTDKGVRDLAQGCPSLSEVNLSDCHRVGDNALSYLGQYCGSNLHALSLRSCHQVTSVGVGWLAEDCPHLGALNLMDCTDVGDSALIALARSCRDIESLNVSGCSVGDEGIAELAVAAPNLVALDLSRCVGVTDEALVAVAAHCGSLECLWLQSCPALTDAALIAVAQGCPHLAVLSVEGCTGVTEAGVKAVLEACTEMEALYLQRTQVDHVQHHGRLEAAHPHVELVRQSSWDHITMHRDL